MPNIDHTGLGSTLTFENEVVRMLNSGIAVVRGDVLETHLDFNVANPVGTAPTTWSAVSLTDSGDQVPARVIGVALEDAAQWEYLRVGFKGVFECACDDDADEGVLLRVSNTAGRLAKADTAPDASPAGYIMMLGIALEDTAVSGDLTKVLFDGLNGFTASHP
tara:strand:+ start:182 stop:670 length:489 start_codon:yes stop_codon:yes gene_type:complete